MPFLTEEIWHLSEKREATESIMTAEMPKANKIDKEIIAKFETVKTVITNIRKIRKEKNLPNKEKFTVNARLIKDNYDKYFNAIIKKTAGVEQINLVKEKTEGAISFIVKNVEYYIPLGDIINKEEEIIKLEKELKYQKGFLNSILKKLSNERFVNNAPEKVVNIEKTKQADAESKIKAIEEQIEGLKK